MPGSTPPETWILDRFEHDAFNVFEQNANVHRDGRFELRTKVRQSDHHNAFELIAQELGLQASIVRGWLLHAGLCSAPEERDALVQFVLGRLRAAAR